MAQKGWEEGRQEGEIDLICKYLQTRFGRESSYLQKKVKQIGDLDSLNQLSDKIFLVQTVDEAAKVIDEVLDK